MEIKSLLSVQLFVAILLPSQPTNRAKGTLRSALAVKWSQKLCQICIQNSKCIFNCAPGILLGGPLALAPIHEDRGDTVLFVLLLEQAQGCLQDDLHKGDDEVEDEPDVDELHVGRPWQRVGDADEEGRQHQKRGDIHGCNGFKVGFLYIYRVEKILIGCALE